MFNFGNKKKGTVQNVTFLGGAGLIDTNAKDQLYDEVVTIAEELAKMGIGIVNGGGPGVMRASTKGAKLAGGHATAVTLEFKDGATHKFEGKDVLNKYDKEVKTDNYFDRTKKLLELGDVHIIVKGATGTFSEFAFAWEIAYLHFGHNKPLILYGDQWYELFTAIDKAFDLRKDEFRVYRILNTPEDVIKYIKDLDSQQKTWI